MPDVKTLLTKSHKGSVTLKVPPQFPAPNSPRRFLFPRKKVKACCIPLWQIQYIRRGMQKNYLQGLPSSVSAISVTSISPCFKSTPSAGGSASSGRASEIPFDVNDEARDLLALGFPPTAFDHSLANVQAAPFAASSSIGSTTVGLSSGGRPSAGNDCSIASRRLLLTYGDAAADRLGCCVVAMTRCHILLRTSTVVARQKKIRTVQPCQFVNRVHSDHAFHSSHLETHVDPPWTYLWFGRACRFLR